MKEVERYASCDRTYVGRKYSAASVFTGSLYPYGICGTSYGRQDKTDDTDIRPVRTGHRKYCRHRAPVRIFRHGGESLQWRHHYDRYPDGYFSVHIR